MAERASSAPTPTTRQAAPDLQTRYDRISAHIIDEHYSPGGQVVLDVAYAALKEKHAAGEELLVGLEDLWSHALQEGMILMNKPEQRWGRTTAEETADMIGQTTIGPWQLTVTNIQNVYGPRYGIEPDWTPAQVNDFCRKHPEVQAKMIIDYIQRSYETLGKRSPYAIQRYFWLEPFVKGEIGQAPDWTKGVVAKPPAGGTWRDLTPAMKADTGFYAKQVLMGAPYTDSGLLYWLAVTGDEPGLREVLTTWRDQKKLVVAGSPEAEGAASLEGVGYVRTDKPGGFEITANDVRYYADEPTIRETIIAAIRAVSGEQAATISLAAPADRPQWQWVEGGVVRSDRAERKLALIFTGGERGEGSEHILDTLAATDVKASFFVTGGYLGVPEHAAWLRRMVDEGHYLGPHSQGHLLYAPWENRSESLVTEAQFKDDLRENITALQAYGALRQTPMYFIPPFEWYNAQHSAWAREENCLLFNFTPGSGSHRDWIPEGHEKFQSSADLLQGILAFEAAEPDGLNGHLMLLHLGGERKDKMYLQLRPLIDELRQRGYRLVRVDELLPATP